MCEKMLIILGSSDAFKVVLLLGANSREKSHGSDKMCRIHNKRNFTRVENKTEAFAKDGIYAALDVHTKK
jgi:hypothetical protein